MGKIRVLSPHVANQIAAGEVVERPASIVKELTENAIDAHASAITIEIENGGIQSVRILDNGCGISDEDCETAFLRHATSKISVSDDLSRIASLGFRGEALASIAAVSRVTLQTRTAEDELGTLIRYDCGELKEHRRVGGTIGTSVTVRDLFCNVPARLKFLKTPRAESAAIGDYVSRLILSVPSVAIHFTNGGKTVYRSTGDGALLNALISVYSVGMRDMLLPISFDDGYIRIEGFIGTPACARANRSGQTFLLNGRIIRSSALSNALSRAFDTRMMIGRFPFAAVCINLAPAEADVNVHPSKLEVRFADEQRVIRALTIACTNALIGGFVPTVSAEDALKAEQDEPSVRLETDRPIVELRKPVPSTGTFVSERAESSAWSSRPHIPAFALPTRDAPTLSHERNRETPFSAPYSVIGCAFDAYWFIQQGDCVFCIDQHAAHERLLYDALIERRAQTTSQTLFIPEQVALLPTQAFTLEQNRGALESFGYIFSELSETSVVLLAVPQVHGTPLKSTYLLQALDALSEEKPLAPNDLVRAKLIQTACKHAIKAGDRITNAEIEAIMTMLRDKETVLSCPHGRPIAVRLEKAEIERMFKRVL